MISTNKSNTPIQSPNQLNMNLLQVLTFLTQRLSQTTYPTFTHEQILIKLLYRIDPSYFQYKFSLQQTYDYESIIKSLVDYYNDRKFEKIKKIYIMQINHVHKFVHIFRLVLDLAMNYNQNEKMRYIEQIINMSQRQKQILMPYVDEVMKRKFVTELVEYKKYTDSNQIQHTQQDQYLETKDHQYQQLRESYQQIFQKYRQLQQNHNSLKFSYDKIFQQNTQIIQQKYQLMNQLGVHPSSTFLQIAEKYKKDIKQFIRQLQRLNKEIEDKNNSIKNKQMQIKKLNAIQNTLTVWEQQKSNLVEKYRKMQIQFRSLQRKQEKLRDQLQVSKNALNKLREQLGLKEKEIATLNKLKQRYKGIKQYHLQFKKRYNQKMKQI